MFDILFSDAKSLLKTAESKIENLLAENVNLVRSTRINVKIEMKRLNMIFSQMSSSLM